MNKSIDFTGQPVFTSLLGLLGKSRIARIASDASSDRYYKEFSTYVHLVSMLFSVFKGCSSLREVVTGLMACQKRISHLGLSYYPKRSTFSDANKKRDSAVFGAVYYDLLKQYRKSLPDSSQCARLYIIDSTTISLFKELLKSLGRPPVNGKRKGGIKAHAVMHAAQDVPIQLGFSAASQNDIRFLDHVKLPGGSIVTFDKAYVNYDLYDEWTRDQVSFVTRIKSNAVYRELNTLEVPQNQMQRGVQSDREIELGHHHNDKITRVRLRLVRFTDAQTNRSFEFLTNNFQLSAYNICLIYKKRWAIELLFKRLKQNFPLKYFLGDNVNAVQIQIWAALIADLLVNIVRSRLRRKWAFSNLVSMIRLHLMTYINLYGFLNDPEKELRNTILASQQLAIFDSS